MPRARQSAAALFDRAERHVFELGVSLSAVERRALALVELGGVSVRDAAADLGIGEDEVRVAVSGARVALRRLRAPLAGGSRCGRFERLLSDSLNGGLDRHERKWLEIHRARCPRCESHEALLGEARSELRDSFADVPPALPHDEQDSKGTAQLRVVPSPVVGGQTGNSDGFDRPRRENVPAPVPAKRLPALTPAQLRAAKIVAIVLAIAALLAGLGLGIEHLSGR